MKPTPGEATQSSGPPLDNERDQILSLCALASEPYDRFVWRTPERARAISTFLWERGAGEVNPTSCTVWRDGHGVLGVLTQLSGHELRRARLKAAVVLAKSEALSLSATERELARLAGTALASVPPEDLYLARIAVDTRARGIGVGKVMIAELLRSAATIGAHSVVLEVEAANILARSVYEAAGFSVTADREVPEHDGIALHFVEMRLSLARPRAFSFSPG